VEPLQRYVMTYTAFSARGPRIALAISEDLFHWKRLGLAAFGPYQGIEFANVDDKDASLFPVAIPNPSGHPELAIIHRPLFPGTRPEETACHPASREVDLDRESIWISYCPPPVEGREPNRLGKFVFHRRLAAPVSPWERLQNRRRHSAHPGPARLADRLPWRERNRGAGQCRAPVCAIRPG